MQWKDGRTGAGGRSSAAAEPGGSRAVGGRIRSQWVAPCGVLPKARIELRNRGTDGTLTAALQRFMPGRSRRLAGARRGLASADGLLPGVSVPLQGFFRGSDEIRPAERTAGVGVLRSRGMPE